jgi:hypothetical protein
MVIESNKLAVFTAYTHRFNRQVGNAPHVGMIKQDIEYHFATFHGPLDAVPAPAQMYHKRQGSSG